MNNKLQQFIAGFSFLILLYCFYQMNHPQKVQVQKAVYNWKTNFSRSTYYNAYEDSFLTSHQIKKMYVKMLDIDYSEAAGIFPVSKTEINYWVEPNTDSLNYVPVVYITNKVLQHLKEEDMDYYAKRILSFALRIETYTKRPTQEIQIDCDWTKTTKETYFNLLLCIQKWAPQFQYSVTLRLYPFKYREELGIPPVDRVMLMVYNIDNAKKFKSANSIFNVNEAAKYLARKDYPLPMDFALPTFSWTLVFRNQQFLKVISENIIPEIIAPRYVGDVAKIQLQKLEENVYLVKEATSGYQENALRAGDIIKVESCGEKELLEARLLISRFAINTKTTIALFDLDQTDLEKIPYEKIEAAYFSMH